MDWTETIISGVISGLISSFVIGLAFYVKSRRDSKRVRDENIKMHDVTHQVVTDPDPALILRDAHGLATGVQHTRTQTNTGRASIIKSETDQIQTDKEIVSESSRHDKESSNEANPQDLTESQ